MHLQNGNRTFRSQFFNDETLLENIPSLFASLVGRSRIKNALCSTKSLQHFLAKTAIKIPGKVIKGHTVPRCERAGGIGLGALIWFGGNPVNDQTYDVSKITAANAIRYAAYPTGNGLVDLELGTRQTQPARSGRTTDRAPALSHRSLPIAAISRRRARASRDITVPIGTSVVSAISR